ncbi:MAG: hypothetical protein RL757_3278 [Bacteroidota bacterium]
MSSCALMQIFGGLVSAILGGCIGWYLYKENKLPTILEEKDDEMGRVKLAHDEMQTRFQKMSQNVNTLQLAHDDWKTKTVSIQQEYQDLERSKFNLNQEFLKFQQNSGENMARLGEEIKSWQVQNDEKTHLLNDAQTQIDTLKKAAETSVGAAQKVQENLVTQRNVVANQLQELDGLHQEIVSSYQQFRQDTQTKILTLSEEKTNLQAEMVKMNEEKEQTRQKYVMLEGEKYALINVVKEIEQSKETGFADWGGRYNKLENEMERKEADMNELMQTHQNLLGQTDGLRTELAAQQTKMTEFEAAVAKAQTDAKRSEKDAASVRARYNSEVGELVSEIESYKSRYDNALAAQQTSSRMVADLEAELARYRKQKVVVETLKVDENDVLTRISAQQAYFDFSKIGLANADERDNLEKIRGIGAFAERKLNALGIYKFSQIAALDDAQVVQLNEILEFFEGRIERDNWVGQAREIVGWVAPTNGIAQVVQVVAAPEDLKIVEGIGPKIEELLNADGIFTFAQLAEASTERLQGILDKAGSRYRMHDPATWARQSALAQAGEWDALKIYQDELKAGREVS